MTVQTIYEEYKEKILHMARKFSVKSGREVDELVSIGFLSLCKAVETHDPCKGELAHYVTFMVRKGWQEQCRQDVQGLPAMPMDPTDLQQCCGSYSEDVSEDANLLVRIALNPPIDVQVNADIIKRKYSRGVILQMAIVEYLMDLGWAMYRIEEGFSEVRELLHG